MSLLAAWAGHFGTLLSLVGGVLVGIGAFLTAALLFEGALAPVERRYGRAGFVAGMVAGILVLVGVLSALLTLIEAAL